MTMTHEHYCPVCEQDWEHDAQSVLSCTPGIREVRCWNCWLRDRYKEPSAFPKFRIDVTLMEGTADESVGLVTHNDGEEPKHPTLFVSAHCPSPEDKAWFQKVIEELTK